MDVVQALADATNTSFTYPELWRRVALASTRLGHVAVAAQHAACAAQARSCDALQAACLRWG